jgi:hypothetical protein
MAVIRYILDRSAYGNPSHWNPAELRSPLLSDLLHRSRALHVPVENEPVLRYRKKRTTFVAHLWVEITHFDSTYPKRIETFSMA